MLLQIAYHFFNHWRCNSLVVYHAVCDMFDDFRCILAYCRISKLYAKYCCFDSCCCLYNRVVVELYSSSVVSCIGCDCSAANASRVRFTVRIACVQYVLCIHKLFKFVNKLCTAFNKSSKILHSDTTGPMVTAYILHATAHCYAVVFHCNFCMRRNFKWPKATFCTLCFWLDCIGCGTV